MTARFSEHPGSVRRDELTGLLDLAEDMQRGVDGLIRRRLMYSTVGASLIVLAILLGALFSLYIRTQSARVLGFALVGTLLALASALLYGQTRWNWLARRDQRALGEVVSLLREIESTTAAGEGWSPLQRAEFRIRLSRFSVD